MVRKVATAKLKAQRKQDRQALAGRFHPGGATAGAPNRPQRGADGRTRRIPTTPAAPQENGPAKRLPPPPDFVAVLARPTPSLRAAQADTRGRRSAVSSSSPRPRCAGNTARAPIGARLGLRGYTTTHGVFIRIPGKQPLDRHEQPKKTRRRGAGPKRRPEATPAARGVHVAAERQGQRRHDGQDVTRTLAARRREEQQAPEARQQEEAQGARPMRQARLHPADDVFHQSGEQQRPGRHP